MLVEQAGARPPAVDVRLIERLCLYDWPFNVRELALLVRRLLVLHGTEPTLKVAHLPERLRSDGAPSTREPAKPVPNPDGPELGDLLAALRECGGNVAKAAVQLGISRQRAYRMMQGQVDLTALREQGEEV
jgi:transcriptional regulator of acetoin/glycerol metabolism